MTSSFHNPVSNFISCVDCRATLERLVGNSSGFIYRRRHDARWTMEFVSDGCRDITGYDPHRFIANQSLAFADLIARPDWRRVNAQLCAAAQHGRRITLDYLIRAAHGAWVHVEDRLTPVVNAAGKVLAIEGVIDRTRCPTPGEPVPLGSVLADAQPDHQILVHHSN
jgi:PAS domain-containing protein